MWKAMFGVTTALVIVGSSVVYAQQDSRGTQRQRWQPSQEDVAAFAAARIAALKAGLMLTAEQEKNWPQFESALKDVAKLRHERREARRNEREARRDRQAPQNPVERLRRRADNLAAHGAALKKLADAQEPLYNSLDDAQKRRFAILARPRHGHGWRNERRHRHGMGRARFDDRGGHRHFGRRGDAAGAGPDDEGDRRPERGGPAVEERL